MADFPGSLRSDMIEWLMQIGSPTAPASTHWISFHTGDPAGTGANECTTISREQHDSWDNNGDSTDGVIANNGAGESSAATAGGPETISHFGVYTLSSGGVFIFGGALTASKQVSEGDTLSWADGDLTATLS
jgi:hypothetical protein